MREAKTKTINETTYIVNQLQPSRSLDLLLDLVKMIGPAAAPIFANVSALSSFMDKDVEGMKLDFLGEAVRALCSGVDKEITKAAIKTLAGVTVIDGKGKLSDVFEIHFASVGMGEMLAWVWFALQTQYDDFLGVFGNAIKSVPRPMAKA